MNESETCQPSLIVLMLVCHFHMAFEYILHQEAWYLLLSTISYAHEVSHYFDFQFCTTSPPPHQTQMICLGSHDIVCESTQRSTHSHLQDGGYCAKTLFIVSHESLAISVRKMSPGPF